MRKIRFIGGPNDDVKVFLSNHGVDIVLETTETVPSIVSLSMQTIRLRGTYRFNTFLDDEDIYIWDGWDELND